ncbi:Transmembrane and coiled-coil domain-containing protein 4 [Dichanthelium oligosanthes]|uniref:Transmembrane and coiled-coil domain-containing protein 4 n=1 Tax=Dichanthelium oligosanthes TaxID=888268 RepID=A0A1E5VP25_9POAL|nr:Transmembrane and coiled-coil domain-containing protein 4 [Dichanthelium oligosanthes]
MAASTTLGQTQRYAAGALLALALRQAQTHQTVLLGSHGLDDQPHPDAASAVEADARDLWTHESRGLLRPVLRFLEIDPKAWAGVEKTAASSDPKHHIGAFLRHVFEDEDDDEKARSERSDQELALAKAVDAMAMGLESGVVESVAESLKSESCSPDDPALAASIRTKDYRKMAVLYMLLSACVADVNMAEEGMGSPRFTKGYDARHRVALRLLATWLDVKWNKMDAVEIMVACSAMAAAKEQEESREDSSPSSRWENWKRGGIIGAAALTGGTLMAISGGLAAPAIAAGFTALAPTLHTLVPIIGASGFAAIATAAGHTAGSVAVAASFGGVAMELMREGAMQTVLSGIISAFAWPATLVSAADFIDSKWSVAIDSLINLVDASRSDKAGKMLADVLLKGLQGSRPVTLVGFSLGARVVFKCLQELAQLGNNEGIVERAVLIGAPVSVRVEMWEPARKVKKASSLKKPPFLPIFVNVYSTNDWILGITFRASLLTQGLAGIQAVDVPGVENVDVTELVVGHSSYLSFLQQILDHLELNTYYPVFHPCTPRAK